MCLQLFVVSPLWQFGSSAFTGVLESIDLNIIVLPQENLQALQTNLNTEIIPVSGKTGENLHKLLQRLKEIHNSFCLKNSSSIENVT